MLRRETETLRRCARRGGAERSEKRGEKRTRRAEEAEDRGLGPRPEAADREVLYYPLLDLFLHFGRMRFADKSRVSSQWCSPERAHVAARQSAGSGAAS